MGRHEFSAKTKAQAFTRAAGFCEGNIVDEHGSTARCSARLTVGKFAYDHIIAEGLTGGKPTLENCAVLCLPCHTAKTRRDVSYIAKAKRVEKKHLGIRKKSKFACSKDSPWRKKVDGTVVRR